MVTTKQLETHSDLLEYITSILHCVDRFNVNYDETKHRWVIKATFDSQVSEPSDKQNERQKARHRNGKYRNMNRCEVCNKPLGEDYYSDRRVDTSPEWGGIGLCLCGKCAGTVDILPDEQALEILRGR